MKELKADDFYLEIELKNKNTIHIMVPSVDFNGMIYEYTYADVIDAYTTKFNDMHELLDDIRRNGYADIENISNDEIVSINFRHKERDINGCFEEVAYSNATDVINYLYGEDNYRKVFEENFKRYVVGRVVSQDIEYRKFLSANFTRVYSNALRCDADKFALGEYEFNLGGSPECFSKYYNVRAHCLINHDKLDAKFALERELKKGNPYDAETKADLDEAKENAFMDYPKRSVIDIQKEFLGERFVSYPGRSKEEKRNEKDVDNIEKIDDYRESESLVVEDGIKVDNLSFGANIQDEAEYTIDPDAYEEFLNSNPIMEGTGKRK